MSDGSKPAGIRLLTPADAAERLAISTAQLRELSRDGAIRYVNIGRGQRETRRYDPADLDAFIEERKCRSTNVRVNPHPKLVFYAGENDFRVRRAARLAGKLKGVKGSK